VSATTLLAFPAAENRQLNNWMAIIGLQIPSKASGVSEILWIGSKTDTIGVA
jgi:hypothetical protein